MKRRTAGVKGEGKREKKSQKRKIAGTRAGRVEAGVELGVLEEWGGLVCLSVVGVWSCREKKWGVDFGFKSRG